MPERRLLSAEAMPHIGQREQEPGFRPENVSRAAFSALVELMLGSPASLGGKGDAEEGAVTDATTTATTRMRKSAAATPWAEAYSFALGLFLERVGVAEAATGVRLVCDEDLAALRDTTPEDRAAAAHLWIV